MQDNVDAVHKLPDVEPIEAFKQIRSYAPALVRRRTGIGVLHVLVTPLLGKTACQDAHHGQEETEEE